MYIFRTLRIACRGLVAPMALAALCMVVPAGCGREARPSMECDPTAMYATIKTLCADSLGGRRAGSGNDLLNPIQFFGLSKSSSPYNSSTPSAYSFSLRMISFIAMVCPVLRAFSALILRKIVILPSPSLSMTGSYLPAISRLRPGRSSSAFASAVSFFSASAEMT